MQTLRLFLILLVCCRHAVKARNPKVLTPAPLVCPKGRFVDIERGDCQPCPKGFFQPNRDSTATSCSPCPAGRFADKLESTLCQMCALGQFNSICCQQECKFCSFNYYSDALGQPFCKECPNGKFTTSRGRTTCSECLAGQHNEILVQAHKYARHPTLVPTHWCGAGTFGFKKPQNLFPVNNRGVCLTTMYDVSEHSSLTAKELEICASESDERVAKIDRCTMCPTGQYNSENAFVPIQNPQLGVRIKLKTAISGVRHQVCPHEMTFNSYSRKKSHRCKYCREYRPFGILKPNAPSQQSSCTSCDRGEWVNSISGTKCCKCGENEFMSRRYDPLLKDSLLTENLEDHYVPVSRENNEDDCKCGFCAIGKEPFVQIRNRDENRDARVGCMSCMLGKYRDAQTYSRCKACPAGQHTSNGLFCQSCSTTNSIPYLEILSLGTSLTELRQKRISLLSLPNIQQIPAAGTDSDIYDYYNNTATKFAFEDVQKIVLKEETNHECLRNWYRAEFHAYEIQDKVRLCCITEWINGKCSALTYQQYTAQTAATPQPSNSTPREVQTLGDLVSLLYWKCTQDTNNNCKILAEPRDVTSIEPYIPSGTLCQLCPRGRLAENGSCEIQKCEPGKYPNNDYDAQIPNSEICLPCPTNTFNAKENNTELCKNCAKGQFTHGLQGQTFCTPKCVPGKFGAGFFNSQRCRDCPTGKYSNENTRTNECEPITNCLDGQYWPILFPATTNATISCPAGKYKQTETCEAPCQLCPSGKYSVADTTKITDCDQCPEGQYQDFDGRTFCKTIECLAGTYENSNLSLAPEQKSKQNFCLDCPAGKHTYSGNRRTKCCSETSSSTECAGTFEFEDYDVVRQRLYPCYDTHDWDPKQPANTGEETGTLVLCKCNPFGEQIGDDAFQNELATQLNVRLSDIRTALKQFYLFEEIYHENSTLTHNIKFKFADGNFNFEPFKNSRSFKFKKPEIFHGINVLTHAYIGSVLQVTKENMCWAMLLKFLSLRFPKIISNTLDVQKFQGFSAYSPNQCDAVVCPRETLNQDSSGLSISSTEIDRSSIHIQQFRCDISFAECFEFCSNHIDTTFDICGFVSIDEGLSKASKELKTTWCSNSFNSLCAVLKQKRPQIVNDVQAKVQFSHLWQLNDFECLHHTQETRKLVRNNCFRSADCKGYATKSNQICYLRITPSAGSKKLQNFTRVYDKVSYDESRQRLRIENIDSNVDISQSNVNRAKTCKQTCYDNKNCYAWQFDKIQSNCLVLASSQSYNLSAAANLPMNQQCAKKLLNQLTPATCAQVNNRMNHYEVNRFWIDTCCNGNRSTPFARLGCTECDTEELDNRNSLDPQAKKYCGLHFTQLTPSDSIVNSFFANEGDKNKFIIDDKFQYRIGNFRDGFSDFIDGCSTQRVPPCLCDFQTFLQRKNEIEILSATNFVFVPPTVSTRSFCQRRGKTDSVTSLSCGQISSRQASVEFYTAPSCEVCPFTHRCDENSNVCVKSDRV